MRKQNVRELLVREEKARKQILSPIFSALGLAPGQGRARILAHLLQRDHITQKELADACKLDVTTMSRNLDKLETMGLLSREANPGCRRSFLICLTEKGRVEAGKIHNVLDQFDHMICKDISEDEITLFCNILNKLCTNLETLRVDMDTII